MQNYDYGRMPALLRAPSEDPERTAAYKAWSNGEVYHSLGNLPLIIAGGCEVASAAGLAAATIATSEKPDVHQFGAELAVSSGVAALVLATFGVLMKVRALQLRGRAMAYVREHD